MGILSRIIIKYLRVLTVVAWFLVGGAEDGYMWLFSGKSVAPGCLRIYSLIGEEKSPRTLFGKEG